MREGVLTLALAVVAALVIWYGGTVQRMTVEGAVGRSEFRSLSRAVREQGQRIRALERTTWRGVPWQEK